MIRKFFYLLLLPGAVAYGQGKVAVRKVNTELNGEIGEAQQRAIHRLFQPPFTTLAWIRADLTNETASADDHNGKSVMKRPFKNFSGDISGRYLELMAILSKGDLQYHPVLLSIVKQVPTLQKPDGTFGWGQIDWNGPIDFDDKNRTPLMMPALWGNGRMLCGLVKSYEVFKEPALLGSAKKLGDFYVRTADRFMNPARIPEYKKGGTYASGFVTCYFNAFEGLVKLYGLTKEDKYLQISKRMAAFLLPFDQLPLDHTHGMLCNHFALLQLYEQTGNKAYLQQVENRWTQMISGGYADPTGGVLESTKIGYARDEGCAETDWLRVNLELFKVTGNAKYLDESERLMQNHYLINQNSSGGFGHRFIINDHSGVIGISRYSEEATWCCDFHGTQGFELLQPFVCTFDKNTIHVNYAMDFNSAVNSSLGKFEVKSTCAPLLPDYTVFKQTIRLSGITAGAYLSVRLPSWATGLTAKAENGRKITLVNKSNFYTTAAPLGSIKVIFLEYGAPVIAEDRTGNRVKLAMADRHSQDVVLRHGPKVLMANGTKTIPELRAGLTDKGMVDNKKAITVKNGEVSSLQLFTLMPRPLGVDSLSSVFVFGSGLK